MMYVSMRLDGPVQKELCIQSVSHTDESQVLPFRNSDWVRRNMLYGYLWSYERK